MKITVCSMDNRDDEFFRIAKSNHHNYCLKHSYKYYEVTDFSKYPAKPTPHWNKFEIIREALIDSDYVFWIDMDALFTNFEMKIESFIPDGDAEIIAAKDCKGGRCKWDYGWNDGVMILKSTDRVLDFCDIMCSPWIADMFSFLESRRVIENWYEQNAFMWLAEEWPKFKGICKEIPAKSFNSYVPVRNVVGNAWSKDDFILHLAGMTQGNRMYFIKQLLK